MSLKMSSHIYLAFFIFVALNIVVNGSNDGFSTLDSSHVILKRLDVLEQRDREQQAELDVVRSENTELRESNINLRKEIERLRERDSQLMDKIKVLEDREIIGSSGLLKQGENEKGFTKNSPAVSSETVHNADQNSIPGKNSLKSSGIREASLNRGHSRIRQSDKVPTIAFFATRSPHGEHLGQHQAVIFDTVVTNLGGGYHVNTGLFQVPVSGVYVFSTTILTYNEDAAFEITVNGRPCGRLWSDHTDSYETLSLTAILNLNKGDDIAIQNRDNDKFVHGSDYSTFSGFLLALK